MTENLFWNKLSDYEKEMYKKVKERNHELNTIKNIIVSPLNDLIRFNPFQYEPYYKLTQQNEYPKAIYIADEVGAGKTIETGIILTELLYKKEYNIRTDVCLIICPNLLCRKWRDTLKSLFGLDASIVYSVTDIHIGINIISFDTISNINDEININPCILIVDEAHNASGGRFERIKNIRNLLNHERGYVVLLSATPLSGKENDDKKQIELLKSNMEYSEDFFNTKSLYLCKNKKTVMRYASNPNKYEIEVHINNHYVINEALILFMNSCAELFSGKNTLLLFQGLNKLMSSPITGGEFIDSLLFKTDDELLGYLNSSHEEKDDDDESEDDFEDGFEDNPRKEYTIDDVKSIRAGLKNVKNKLQTSVDSKFKKLLEVIEDNREKSKKKSDEECTFYKHIVVFTDKLSTARYLETELKKQDNVSVFRVTGELFESEKRTRLQQYENEKEKMSILIITNVACEGQDMDYGNTIVNYDLDYNPVRLEQRRGRIDRFEVKKKNLYIHNFMVKDFDYNHKEPDNNCHKYSKVKKIWDKIQSIYDSTGSYFEIIDKNDKADVIDVKTLEEQRNEVFKHILSMIDTNCDEIITNSDALRAVVIPRVLSQFGNYSSVYDMISDRLRDFGDLEIGSMEGNKISITTSISNQEFLRYLYCGGTLISHLILGER